MAQYVIHKKGFFYTDEAFLVNEDKGSIVAIFDNLEKAKIEKEKEDILSMQRLKGTNAVDFFFYNENYNQVYQKIEEYYQSEYNLKISDKHYFSLPNEINKEQAKRFLDIFGVTFHDIVEYPDSEVLNPNDFNIQNEHLGEF